MIVNSKTRQFQKLKGAEKLILGTVQLGLNYGINNISGKPSLEESFKILDTSFKAGISFLDTAESYGNAVELIGEYHKKTPHNFHVINKFGALSEIRDLNKNVKDNLRKLNIHSFYAYLFHSPADLTNLKSNSAFVKKLQELKQEGLIERLGISIYTNTDFKVAIENPLIEVIQLPFNILDNNNKRLDLLKLAKEKNKEIFSRSVFLQGLIYKDPTELTHKLKPLSKYLERLKNIASDLKISLSQLALSYSLHNPFIDKVLIGVESETQLLKNIQMANDDFQTDFDIIDRNINVQEEELLYPYNWN